MRYLTIPVMALAMSVSSVALAQNQQGGGQPAQPSGGQQAQQSGGQQAKQSGGQQASSRSYQEIEASLKQAGIQNIQALSASYLVSAVTKNGEQVTFVVDPPAAAGAPTTDSGQPGGQASGGQAGSPGQQASIMSQQQVRDSLTKAGFQSVQILDASYLARGQTKNGDQITMMIDPTESAASSGAGGGGSPGGGSPSQPQSGQKQ